LQPFRNHGQKNQWFLNEDQRVKYKALNEERTKKNQEIGNYFFNTKKFIFSMQKYFYYLLLLSLVTVCYQSLQGKWKEYDTKLKTFKETISNKEPEPLPSFQNDN
jgi:hypothetical protein